MYDLEFLDTCAGNLWCMFLGVNTMLHGWPASGLVFLSFIIPFTILQFRDSEAFLNNSIASLFTCFVVGFLLFLGGALFWKILLFVLLLLGIFVIIRQITR